MQKKRVPRQWLKYNYHDPCFVLPRHQRLRIMASQADLPIRVKSMRTRRLQKEREAWDTAVFCYLVGKTLGWDMNFSREEDADFDSIFTWEQDGQQAFAPVQMKELVPAELNPTANLRDIFESLRKYGDSKDLIVGIKLTRTEAIQLDGLTAKDLPISQVWMFGSTEPRETTESTWSLFEEVEGGWIKHDHTLPAPVAASEIRFD